MSNFTKPPAPADVLKGADAFREAVQLVNPQLYSVEERIQRQAKAFDPAMEGYMSYVVDSGGKRLRPVLALLSGGATGKLTSSHVDLAVIVELIHISSLVHDDIMDGADLRRDQPTANAKWGNSLSVLLGDALFAHALRLSTYFENNTISRRISDATVEVCSGEILQTQRRFDLKLNLTDYYKIIEMKTAALFAVSCELGAFLSGAAPEVILAMREFGNKLGIAYQIYDDCVDIAGKEEDAGKTLGTDLQKGKFTLPIILLLQRAPEPVRRQIQEMLLNEEFFDAGILGGHIHRIGAMKAAVATATQLIEDARARLREVPNNHFSKALDSVAAYISSLLAPLGSDA
ncbi:MAG TPA: polyprenyl synthetase family protein [Chthoniobacterales bacterium]